MAKAKRTDPPDLNLPVAIINNPSLVLVMSCPYISAKSKIVYFLASQCTQRVRGCTTHYVTREEIMELWPGLFAGVHSRTFHRCLNELKSVGLIDFKTSGKRPQIAVYIPPEPERRRMIQIEETITGGVVGRRVVYEEYGVPDIPDTKSSTNKRYSTKYTGSLGKFTKFLDKVQGVPDTPTPRLPDPFAHLPTSITQKCISHQKYSKKRVKELMPLVSQTSRGGFSISNIKKPLDACDNHVTNTFAGRGKSAEILEGTSIAGSLLPTTPQSPPPPADFIEGTCDADEKEGTAQLPSTLEAYQALEAEAVRRPRWTRSVSYDKARQAYAIAEAVGVPVAERGVLALIGLWFDLYRVEFSAAYRPHRVHEQARAVYAELSKLLAEEDATRLDGAMRFFLSNRKTAFKRIRCWRIDTFCKIIGDVLATQVQSRDVRTERTRKRANAFGRDG